MNILNSILNKNSCYIDAISINISTIYGFENDNLSLSGAYSRLDFQKVDKYKIDITVKQILNPNNYFNKNIILKADNRTIAISNANIIKDACSSFVLDNELYFTYSFICDYFGDM